MVTYSKDAKGILYKQLPKPPKQRIEIVEVQNELEQLQQERIYIEERISELQAELTALQSL